MPTHGLLHALRGLLAAALLAVLLAGIPWGLIHYIGWPLPHTLPTWAETEAVLLTPMSTTFLLNTLACVLWPVWAAFAYDVTRTALHEARPLPHPPTPSTGAGPLHTLAAMLVGALTLTLLTQRPPNPADVAPAAVAATSTPFEHPRVEAARPAGAPLDAPEGTVRVRLPHDGIYDSLWRIAERTLGDGNLWPRIYTLNHNRPQPDGRTLTNPNLIRPGWILHLPPSKPRQPPPRTNTPATPSPSPDTTPPTPSPPPAHDTPAPDRPGGISLPSGAFVGIGLATLITATLLTARRRHRIHYQPGSGRRDDLTPAPVVRALRIAHDTAPPPPPDDARQTQGQVIGVKAGQTLAWNLARSKGLGLTGPGAPDATRALLVTLLAEHQTTRHIELLVPAPDILTLLGNETRRPPALHVVDTLDTALDMMEAELLLRTPSDPDARPAPAGPPAADLILIATPAPHAERRLQSVLDNGSALGLAGILLGPWHPGDTAHVRTDGTVTTTNPDAQHLTGTCLFTLPTPDTRDLLTLLHQAQPPRTAAADHHADVAEHPASDQGPARPRRPLTNGAGPRADQPPDPHDTEQDAPPRPPSPPTELPETADRPAPPRQPLHLTVLGPTRLTHRPPDSDEHTDLITALVPKQREILTYLALHRDGTRRETLAAALWPDAPQDHPYNAFHATLSQLRRALRTATHDAVTDITTHAHGHYSLDHHQVTVDLWHLQDALDTARHTTGEQHHRTTLEHVVTLYTGDFASDLTAEWTEAPREALRRDVLDAISSLVRILRTAAPEQALALLEHTRTLDPYNEAVYRDIGRLQAHLGHHDAVPRTLTLLTTTLAEIDARPSPETLSLFQPHADA
ncbi:hypothetical protein IAG44_39935 [Streptomyces roseirectus]|uniref:Bacterial transcriptional activator domain-containing protein n=1 Tax=Streptomyces roseirectus TaxID=2768066 RepID=A0A7H0IQB7_9ACTN|nr:hypothetical protein [Streptomyces roseirectus]QNP74983.1 hypothetical protein IAG44_39935 [Streptomyces roseirectus]